MLEFALSYPDVYKVLPSEYREILKLHRQYIANVIFTVVGKPFQDWINGVAELRNSKIIED